MRIVDASGIVNPRRPLATVADGPGPGIVFGPLTGDGDFVLTVGTCPGLESLVLVLADRLLVVGAGWSSAGGLMIKGSGWFVHRVGYIALDRGDWIATP